MKKINLAEHEIKLIISSLLEYHMQKSIEYREYKHTPDRLCIINIRELMNKLNKSLWSKENG
jgi:hypothetical protein